MAISNSARERCQTSYESGSRSTEKGPSRLENVELKIAGRANVTASTDNDDVAGRFYIEGWKRLDGGPEGDNMDCGHEVHLVSTIAGVQLSANEEEVIDTCKRRTCRATTWVGSQSGRQCEGAIAVVSRTNPFWSSSQGSQYSRYNNAYHICPGGWLHSVCGPIRCLSHNPLLLGACWAPAGAQSVIGSHVVAQHDGGRLQMSSVSAASRRQRNHPSHSLTVAMHA